MLMGGWTTVSVVLTACVILTNVLPLKDVAQKERKSENFFGFSFNSRSLSLMTWEIAFRELVALNIPLTGSWILKSEQWDGWRCICGDDYSPLTLMDAIL